MYSHNYTLRWDITFNRYCYIIDNCGIYHYVNNSELINASSFRTLLEYKDNMII